MHRDDVEYAINLMCISTVYTQSSIDLHISKEDSHANQSRCHKQLAGKR